MASRFKRFKVLGLGIRLRVKVVRFRLSRADRLIQEAKDLFGKAQGP